MVVGKSKECVRCRDQYLMVKIKADHHTCVDMTAHLLCKHPILNGMNPLPKNNPNNLPEQLLIECLDTD